MKNDLNAARHFITFLKRSRNLAVTDPDLRASLDNTNDVVLTFNVCAVQCLLTDDVNKLLTLNCAV